MAPTTRDLASLLAAPGVTVRAFADRRGALVVTRRQVILVELDSEKMSERVASFLFDFDRAVSRLPITTTVVRSEADVEKLHEIVARRP